jgi:hypothetical protein
MAASCTKSDVAVKFAAGNNNAADDFQGGNDLHPCGSRAIVQLSHFTPFFFYRLFSGVSTFYRGSRVAEPGARLSCQGVVEPAEGEAFEREK